MPSPRAAVAGAQQISSVMRMPTTLYEYRTLLFCFLLLASAPIAASVSRVEEPYLCVESRLGHGADGHWDGQAPSLWMAARPSGASCADLDYVRVDPTEAASVSAELRARGQAQARVMVADTASRGWTPDRVQVDASVNWEGKSRNGKDEAEVRGSAEWKRGRDEVSAHLRAEYERSNDVLKQNEQNLRLLWYRNLSGPWYRSTEAQLERNQFKEQGLLFDYLFAQIGLGLGYRQEWTEDAETRLAVSWHLFDVRLLDYDFAVDTHAPSLTMTNTLKLPARWRLNQWTHWFWWEDGSIGVESETELLLEAGRNTAVGLRHEYSRDAATLQQSDKNETSLFLRYRF
mgnify:FL=1|jgi:hypothetical protein